MSFVITAAVSGFFGFIAGQKIAERRQTALQLAAARRPVLAYMTDESSRAEAAIRGHRRRHKTNRRRTLGRKYGGGTAAEGRQRHRPRRRSPSRRRCKKNLEANALNVTQPDTAESKPATSPAAKKDLSANIWSVQISATQDRTAAQLLQDKLKSKGFDAFIVEAEINSARWYRVRVGRFPTSQEAEKTRQDLQSKENLASAFVTGK